MNKFFQFFRGLVRFIRDRIRASKAYKQKNLWFRRYGPCILSDDYVDGLLPISTSYFDESDFVFPADNVKIHIESYRLARKCTDAQIKLSGAPINIPQNEAEEWLKIDDFRIVWCDGAETKSWEDRPFSYLGIRLTESLILHESYVPSTIGKNIEDWCEHCDARMLSLDELKLVLMYKATINNLREDMWDTELNTGEGQYWALDKQAGSSKLVIYREDGTCLNGEQNYHCAAVLLLAVKV